MPAFPRFIGGPNLGSNLNDSMTAKAAIVGQLLAIMFPGIVVYLVQGSPSGSPASGGTHVDQGDAGDFTYGYPDGRAAGLVTYLMASILWRMLDCLSYVRGFDVNKDGIPDDSFSQHNHVIDREGGGKAWAVRNQISQFVAHLDGLVGGRADREKVVPQSMTLAEYQTLVGRATFLLRFKALTSEAIALPAHTEPPATTEDDMRLYKVNTTGQVFWATDVNCQELVDQKFIDVGIVYSKAEPQLVEAAFITNLREIQAANRLQSFDNMPAQAVAGNAVNIDPAAIKAAIDAALADVTFTTRKA